MSATPSSTSSTPPAAFRWCSVRLTPAGLTQVSGETATGSQQTTFNAMNQFMGVMTDPFVAGRDDPVSAGGNPNAFADDQTLAYAAKRKPECDALAAIYTKAPPVAPAFEQRWSVWAAGFGGSQTTDWRSRSARIEQHAQQPCGRRGRRRLPYFAEHAGGLCAGRWRHQFQLSMDLARAGPTCSRPVPSSGTMSARPISPARWPMAGRTSPPIAP